MPRLLTRLRLDEGAVLLQGFFFIALVLMTVLPGLYGIGQVVNAQARLTLAAQTAAYAGASTLEDANQVGMLRIDDDGARARVLATLQQNLTGPEIRGLVLAFNPSPAAGQIDTRVWNVPVTVGDSRTVDPDCTSALNLTSGTVNCWRDSTVGSYHRTGGVSVTVRVPVRICGTWSPQLLRDGSRGCWTIGLTGRGFADYATEQITAGSVRFETQMDPQVNMTGTTDEPSLTVRWRITEGSVREGYAVRCAFTRPTGGESVSVCPQQPQMDGEWATVSYQLPDEGRYGFQLRAIDILGSRVSSTKVLFTRAARLAVRTPVVSDPGPAASAYQVKFQVVGREASSLKPYPASYCTFTVLNSDGVVLRASTVNCFTGSDGAAEPTFTYQAAKVAGAASYRLSVVAVSSAGTEALKEGLWQVSLGERTWTVDITGAIPATSAAIPTFDWLLTDSRLSYALGSDSYCVVQQSRDSGATWYAVGGGAPCKLANGCVTRAENGNCVAWQQRPDFAYDTSGSTRYRFVVKLCTLDNQQCNGERFYWTPQGWFFSTTGFAADGTLSWTLRSGSGAVATNVTVDSSTSCIALAGTATVEAKSGTSCMQNGRTSWSWKPPAAATVAYVSATVDVRSASGVSRVTLLLRAPR